jgi:hypothetical protein
MVPTLFDSIQAREDIVAARIIDGKALAQQVRNDWL